MRAAALDSLPAVGNDGRVTARWLRLAMVPDDAGRRGVRPGGLVLEGRVLAVIVLAAALAGCSGQSSSSPEVERGRQVYVAHCTSCHASDPAQNGPLGPAVKGSSRELLEARLLRGTYPPGYTPKRPSAVMQPMPHLAGSLDDLAAYVR